MNLPNPPRSLSVPEGLQELANKKLISLLAGEPRNEPAWEEFLRRFQTHICRTLSRECGRIGYDQGKAQIQDLSQEVYRRLLQNDCTVLKRFKGSFENSIFKYLEIIAIRIAHDGYRKDTAEKRPPADKKLALHLPIWNSPDQRAIALGEILPSEDWLNGMAQFELMEEIEHCLHKILCRNRHQERNGLIFKWHIYHGLNAEHIATLQGIMLSGKRVFGILQGIKKELRKCLGEKN